jgi:hypothetical protein
LSSYNGNDKKTQNLTILFTILEKKLLSGLKRLQIQLRRIDKLPENILRRIIFSKEKIRQPFEKLLD